MVIFGSYLAISGKQYNVSTLPMTLIFGSYLMAISGKQYNVSTLMWIRTFR